MRPLRIVGALCSLLMACVLGTLPVFAITAPDSGPYLTRVDMYRHCLEDDDILAVVRYNIPYASTPNETISQAFVGRLMYNTTEIARILPYSYYNKGYGYGGFAMYLDPSEASGYWESENISAELRGSPTLEWSPSIPGVSTTSINWRATTSTSATQALLYSHLTSYAEELSDYWNVALTSSTSEGTKLSSYGEAYFTNVIAELRTMCPALFTSGTEAMEYTDVDWESEQGADIADAWPFDWGGVSEWLGMPSDDEIFRTLIGLVLAFIICAVVMGKTNRTDFTLAAGYGLLWVGTVGGMIIPVVAVGLTFLSLLGVGLVFIVGKAS